MPFAFFAFNMLVTDSGNAKFKDSRNKIVNKGSGKRSSSSGHNTCVPKSPWNLNSLYTLGRFVPGEKRVSHAINKKYFFVLHGPSLPFSCESKFTFLPGTIICNLFATCSPKSVGHLGNHIWEHFGSLMGTWCEHIGSQRKKNKKIPCPPLPPPPLKKKKKKDHSHWLHEISLSKNVHHQFFAWATLMPILKNWGYLFC